MSSVKSQAAGFIDQLIMPVRWHIFNAGSRKLPLPDVAQLKELPETLVVAQNALRPAVVSPVRCQHDLCAQLGSPPYAMGQTAYVYLQLNAEQDQQVTLGLGWDHWLMGWLNGRPLYDGRELQSELNPPSIRDTQVTLNLQVGINTLVLRIVGGTGPCILAIGGPAELQNSDDRSLSDNPLEQDPRWSSPSLQTNPTSNTKPIDIASRLELLVSPLLIDTLAGEARHQLHQPQPREVVLTLDEPWESNFSGNFMPITAMQEPGRIRLYYYAANWQGDEPADKVLYAKAKHHPKYAPAMCVAESADGIHFTRPTLNLFEHRGSTQNNMIWNENQYFTPFVDTNPNAPADAKYKAISRHPIAGLGAYASADGIHWRHYHDKPIITQGKFDSQNLVFWNAHQNCYVEYHRGQPDKSTIRGIMRTTSSDFIHWSEPTQVTYTDDRAEQMYTNCIAPYARAPHLLIGTPARYVSHRFKDQSHPERSISDSILMTSRDGKVFDRWEQAFLRPNLDPEQWTDRNNYLAWGMPQTGDHELSVYWCENNGHPGVRIHRGIMRLDGFASIHAPGHAPGELLTKPFTFTGNALHVNYATSAAGSMLFELCDEQGRALAGYSLADSETLYGNEIDHIVRWPGVKGDLSAFNGRPVRLRVRLHDADLYAFQFKG